MSTIDLFSHEALSGNPTGKIEKLPFTVADNLKKAYPDAKILIIIRNQFDYILSYYTFRVAVKGQEYMKFSKFLKYADKIGLFKKLFYHELIEYYHHLFGNENVKVIPMELLKENKTRFIKDIIKFIGVNAPKEINHTPRNVSTKKILILKFWIPFNFLFTYLINSILNLFKKDNKDPGEKIRYSYYRMKSLITKGLNKIFKSGKDLDIKNYHKYEELKEVYSQSNYILQDYTNYNIKELGYPYK